jgi:hypothetical protein
MTLAGTATTGVNSWCVERVDSFTIAAWFRRRATFACCGAFSGALFVDLSKSSIS